MTVELHVAKGGIMLLMWHGADNVQIIKVINLTLKKKKCSVRWIISANTVNELWAAQKKESILK